jgi:Raf kinase inhibitor-like YbhB/YbcL family protein
MFKSTRQSQETHEMKQKPLLLAVAIATTTLLLPGCAGMRSPQPPFTLSSPDLAGGTFDQKYILNGFGCKGGNVSPALEWRNVPAGTKSLAIQIHDPDAPTGSGFWHWAVYDIPVGTTALARGAGNSPSTLPAGAFGGNTDFLDTGATGGNGNYGGPCPPTGDAPHHYNFTIYALSVDKVAGAAGIPPTGTAGLFSFAINKGVGPALLGKASFTATYGR